MSTASSPPPPNAKPPRDFWEKLQIASGFMSSVLLATVALVVTKCYDVRTAAQQRADRLHQDEVAALDRQRDATDRRDAQRHQQRLAELEALTKLLPILTSKDSIQRAAGERLLAAVLRADSAPRTVLSGAAPASGTRDGSRRTNGGATDRPVGPGTPGDAGNVAASIASPAGTPTLQLIASYAALARERTATPAERADATRRVAAIAESRQAPAEVRQQATLAVARIAADSTVPEPVRSVATAALARIQQIPANGVAAAVASEPSTRAIREIVLHHSGLPSQSFRGFGSVYGAAQFQVLRFGWNRLSFHYAVGPDGSVWRGAPLDTIAYHVGNAALHKVTLSVLLFLNGDAETPTAAQQRAATELMTALFAKYGLSATANFAPGHGLHRDVPRTGGVPSRTLCPGRNVTRELVVGWFAADSTPVDGRR